MPEGKPVFKWTILAQSVCGASHVRSGLPKQDDYSSHPGTDGLPPVILAVADGHGSPKSFRSAVGAYWAAKLATSCAIMFLDGVKDQPPSVIKNLAEQRLPVDLVKRWREVITDDFHQHPFLPGELQKLDKEAGATGLKAVLDDDGHYIAYGTTLLLVMVAETFIIYLQLGDGDILTVSDRTGQVEWPLERDESLMANETTSMCEDDAQRLFRFHFQYIQDSAPALILVSTDGYSNSFSSDDGFKKVGTDLLRMLREDGAERVAGEMKGWLDEASKSGSGDDVTLGVVCRQDAISSATATKISDIAACRSQPAQTSKDTDTATIPEVAPARTEVDTSSAKSTALPEASTLRPIDPTNPQVVVAGDTQGVPTGKTMPDAQKQAADSKDIGVADKSNQPDESVCQWLIGWWSRKS